MKGAIRRAIDLYNRYHSPEARAKIIGYDGKMLRVSIKGSFCTTCGVFDWFDDLRYEMAMLGIQSRITSFEKADHDEFIVLYELVER